MNVLGEAREPSIRLAGGLRIPLVVTGVLEGACRSGIRFRWVKGFGGREVFGLASSFFSMVVGTPGGLSTIHADKEKTSLEHLDL